MPATLQLGNYEMMGLLQRSRMTTVYQARDTRNGQVVALTELVLDDTLLPAEHSEAAARFLEEGQAAMRLRHPYILRTLEVAEDGERCFLATEMPAGNPLQVYLDRKLAIPIINVLDIVLQLCEAVSFAHTQEVIHRFIQPADIFLTLDGRIKLGNFGLARVAGATRDPARWSLLLGNLQYLAPELVENFDSATFRADIYSLGATMYHLLTLRPPISAASPQEFLQKLPAERVVPPRQINAQVPPPIETAIQRCLQKNPTLRFPSCQALFTELLRFRPSLVKIGAASQSQPAAVPAEAATPSPAGVAGVRGGGMGDRGLKLKFKLLFGRSGQGKGELFSPRDVAIIGSKTVCVADYENSRLQLFGMDGNWVSEITSGGPKGGKLTPISLCSDGSGKLYVVDSGDTQIKIYDSAGTFVGQFGAKGSNRSEFRTPTGIAISKQGNIFICDSEASCIHIFNQQNQYLTSIGEPGRNPGELKSPYALGVDDDENMYILEYSLPRVQVMSRMGESLLCFGQRGGSNGEFSVPRGLCIDKYRNVYVADTLNRRIQVFDAQGKLLAAVGHGGTGEGEFAAPEGLDINENMELVVTDKGNNRIQVFQVEIG